VSAAPARPLGPTDRLLAGYALGVAALVAIAGDGVARRWGWVAFHLGVAGLVVLLAKLEAVASPGPWSDAWNWLRRWLPVIALPWLYDAAGRLRHVVVTADLDAWVARWDAAVFPGEWYRIGANLPLPAVELAHAVYFSYYLLLFLPALVAERRDRRAVDAYLFALTATLLGHYVLNFLVPVAGPLAARAAAIPRGVLFVPVMDALYLAFDRGGLAFPSTHTAVAVVAGWFAGRRFFPRHAAAYFLWSVAIAISTVVCGYHYPIDVLAGVATGALVVALAGRSGRASA
jgi:membrane-associated phospholipid phosphatase